MNGASWIVLGCIAVLLAAALLWAHHRKKQGKGCCGNCAQCSCGCLTKENKK